MVKGGYEAKAVLGLCAVLNITSRAADLWFCIDNSGYEASLELHKIYPRLPDPTAAEDGDIRIVDESGEDYLYAANRFIPINVPKALARAMLKKAS